VGDGLERRDGRMHEWCFLVGAVDVTRGLPLPAGAEYPALNRGRRGLDGSRKVQAAGRFSGGPTFSFLTAKTERV
jgi:hypothetical protein